MANKKQKKDFFDSHFIFEGGTKKRNNQMKEAAKKYLAKQTRKLDTKKENDNA